MRAFCLFVLLSFFFAQVLAQTCPTPTGAGSTKYPNLNSLYNSGPATNNKDWQSTDNSGNTYNWNFCGVQNTYPSCGLSNTVVCQNGNSNAKSCGVLVGQVVSVLSNINSLSFFYDQGSPSGSCTVARRTNITVICNPAKGAVTTITSNPGVAELAPTPPATATCAYTISMTSPFVCPGGSTTTTTTTTTTGKTTKKGSLSGGSIFLIVVSCLVFTYVVAGMIYQWQVNQASGWDLCPNSEFWVEFGGLIKGGAVFTWGKLTGSGSGGYTTVPE